MIDANDFHGLLHATGHGALITTSLTNAKTIQAAAAFERCNQLLKPPLPIKTDVFKTLLNARNGVSHLGVHKNDEARQHLITAIRIIDPILSALGVEQEQFWGHYKPLRDELLQKRADDLKLAFMTKIVNAKNVLAARLGPDLGAEDLARLSAELVWIDSDEEPAKCPACGMEGRLTGNHFVERQYDGLEPEEDEDWAVMLYPLGFICPICQLQLELEEFDLAGLPREVRTAHDPYEWAMPDEDMFRDR
ncbi:hypothetical protein [Streptomyces sp. NBC_00154]|uniref:hypothetical protein n=1 Tax=Streptomyces sp. NBC_00154 TaxID=2975670 RepID=UPI002255C9C6|nr:hypothetical protein [Streptomyces sp. NBC_00154]MCX5318142.1 hypothetical protein [Streptomyces sp. NBC_00154]